MGEELKHSWTCRVCLEPKQIGIRSIHENYKEYCIMEYINKLTNVNIKITDGLPDKICNSCFLELEVALNFVEKCENADNILRNKSPVHLDKVKLELDPQEIKSEGDVNDDVCDFYSTENVEYLETDEHENEEEQTKQETPKSQVECHDCGNLFKSKCKLRVHWKQTHMLEALICLYCKRRFKSYKAMHHHMKTKSQACSIARNPNITIEGEGKSRQFHCKECNYKTHRIKTLEAHLRTHSGERPFQCDLCFRGYSQQSSLQAHNESCHKKFLVQITCQYCGKFVKGRNNVYRHLRIHRDGFQPCPVCEKPVTRHNLNAHMRRHTGVKTYTCEMCAASFYSSAELANHRRFVHLKHIYFKCALCEYKSTRKETVTKHQKRHTDKNISCNICGVFSPTEEKALAHTQRIHLGEKKHECLQCDKKFFKKDSIRRHMLAKHRNLVDPKNLVVKCESDQSKNVPIKVEIHKSSPKI